MFLLNYRKVLADALSGRNAVDGMYVLYAAAADTATTEITESMTLADVLATVDGASDKGALRVTNALVQMIVDNGIRFMATTANGTKTHGNLDFGAGVYIYGVAMAELAYELIDDRGLCYKEIPEENRVVVPANGSTAIICEVAC